jgi:hypothetical protein
VTRWLPLTESFCADCRVSRELETTLDFSEAVYYRTRIKAASR